MGLARHHPDSKRWSRIQLRACSPPAGLPSPLPTDSAENSHVKRLPGYLRPYEASEKLLWTLSHLQIHSCDGHRGSLPQTSNPLGREDRIVKALILEHTMTAINYTVLPDAGVFETMN